MRRRNKNPRIFIRGKAHSLCRTKLGKSVAAVKRSLHACVPSQFSFDTRHSTLDTSPMALPPDLHMHTPLCRHATGEPVEYARRALELGFTEIGFSDHSP